MNRSRGVLSTLAIASAALVVVMVAPGCESVRCYEDEGACSCGLNTAGEAPECSQDSLGEGAVCCSYGDWPNDKSATCGCLEPRFMRCNDSCGYCTHPSQAQGNGNPDCVTDPEEGVVCCLRGDGRSCACERSEECDDDETLVDACEDQIFDPTCPDGYDETRSCNEDAESL